MYQFQALTYHSGAFNTGFNLHHPTLVRMSQVRTVPSKEQLSSVLQSERYLEAQVETESKV